MNDSTLLKGYELLYKTRCKELREIGLDYSELNEYDNFKGLMNEDTFKELIRLKQNRKNKRNRTMSKFKELFLLQQKLPNAKIVFITIDPNNETLSKQERTYTKSMNNWLKKHFLYVILNKDYGTISEREHYHALALTVEEVEQLFHENGKPKLSKKGYPMYELKVKDFKQMINAKEMQFEPTLNLIDLEKNNMKQTTNYLLKLNNHSNKETARNRVRIIKSPLMKTCFELRKERY